MKKKIEKSAAKMTAKYWLLSVSLCAYSILNSLVVKAQNGEAGIQEATNKVVG